MIKFNISLKGEMLLTQSNFKIVPLKLILGIKKGAKRMVQLLYIMNYFILLYSQFLF